MKTQEFTCGDQTVPALPSHHSPGAAAPHDSALFLPEFPVAAYSANINAPLFSIYFFLFNLENKSTARACYK
jgi:hypothetical protein